MRRGILTSLALPAIIAGLPGGGVRGCEVPGTGNECPGDGLVAEFLRDPDLCGSGPTAVECHVQCPPAEGLPMACSGGDDCNFVLGGALVENARVIVGNASPSIETESAGFTPISRGTWREHGHLRDPDGYGVPGVHPFVAFRSGSAEIEPDVTRASLYRRSSDIRSGCIIDLAIVWTWTVREDNGYVFADDLESAVKVVRRRGACDSPDFPAEGEAWKLEGELFCAELSICNGGYEDGDLCGPDGWVNPVCDFDPDDPCHYDGVCDEHCGGDLDCGCGYDAYCNLRCSTGDPDCDCGDDGRCNPLCGDDPDCACIYDLVCHAECPFDPDCACVSDGTCNPACGLLDWDCACIVDGLCNEDCEYDQDCLCEIDAYCNPLCHDDLDCSCEDDGFCNPLCADDPDCPCPDDGTCDPGCEFDPDCAPG